jgi:hypothetical protein
VRDLTVPDSASVNEALRLLVRLAKIKGVIEWSGYQGAAGDEPREGKGEVAKAVARDSRLSAIR